MGFSVAVGCTPGVESHEEIACGLAVFDVDTGARIRDVQAAYTIDRHPSGRFKFRFRVSDLGPGLFRLRVAFTIRESGDEPTTAEGEIRVRPAPGYVPPVEEPAPAPLRLERTDDRQATQPDSHVSYGGRSRCNPPQPAGTGRRGAHRRATPSARQPRLAAAVVVRTSKVPATSVPRSVPSARNPVTPATRRPTPTDLGRVPRGR